VSKQLRQPKSKPVGEKASTAGLPASPAASLAWTGKNTILAGLLILLVMVAYWPALSGGYVWDDDKYVTGNPMLTAPDGLRQIWFSAHTQSQYFPLVYTTFRFERMIWGLNPLGFHLINVLLHGINAVLVWILLGRLRVPGAWFAAAIFALHPVQVESVAWVTELKNLESLFFCLLALLAWVRFVDQTSVNRWRYYVLSLIFFLLALFGKTTACTAVVALLLIVWLRRRRFDWSTVWPVFPFAILGVLLGLISIWWERNLGTYDDELQLSFTFLQRLLIAGRALWFYVGKLIWPANLVFSYPRWVIDSHNPMQYLPLLGSAAVAVLLWRCRNRLGRGVIAGVVFFVATISPMLGFISDYTFQYSFVADHYQYSAAIGLFAVVAGVSCTWLAKRHVPALVGPAAGGLLLLVLATLTWRQCGAYHDAETLWRRTLAGNPNSWMAHHNLGVELQDRGQIDEAIEQYQAAVALNPGHVKAQNNLGLCLMAKGDLPEAIKHYNAALALKPDFTPALNNLAIALARTGDYDQAVVQLRRASQIEPGSAGMTMNMGNFLMAGGRPNEAVECFRNGVALSPTDVELRRRLAAALMESGKPIEATVVYREALQLSPDRIDLLTDLGNAWVSVTNYPEAVDSYQKALRINPASAEVRYNLGVVLVAAGKPTEAREQFVEALRLKPDFTEVQKQLEVLSLPDDLKSPKPKN
jgi:tetratricopeptide (TPR) repeat protein